MEKFMQQAVSGDDDKGGRNAASVPDRVRFGQRERARFLPVTSTEQARGRSAMKVFDPKKHDFRPEDKDKLSRSGQTEREAKQEGKDLDEALEETFPASDPPSITTPKKPGPLKRKPKATRPEE
jgi:hypothetical protein